MEGTTNEILEYCKEWKSASEIKEKFQMSDTETYHTLRWLRKGNFVDYCKAGGVNMAREVDNRKFYYQAKK